MNEYHIRRATLEDLEQLVALWQAAQLAPVELEKQFTQFQVAQDAQGKLVAAIALEITGGQGRIHSESFADFALTDPVRPQLWERLQRLAANHGLTRLWTQETAPYWKKAAGLSQPSPEVLATLPPDFGSQGPGWLTLQLKAPAADPGVLERELARYMEEEREKREKLLRRATALRIIGTIIAGIVFIFVLALLVYVVRHRPH